MWIYIALHLLTVVFLGIPSINIRAVLTIILYDLWQYFGAIFRAIVFEDDVQTSQ